MIAINGNLIQAFELEKGNVNLIAGETRSFRSGIIHCVEDSEIEITWSDDTTDNVLLMTNDDVTISNASINVVSGKIHLDTI